MQSSSFSHSTLKVLCPLKDLTPRIEKHFAGLGSILIRILSEITFRKQAFSFAKGSSSATSDTRVHSLQVHLLFFNKAIIFLHISDDFV